MLIDMCVVSFLQCSFYLLDVLKLCIQYIRVYRIHNSYREVLLMKWIEEMVLFHSIKWFHVDSVLA